MPTDDRSPVSQAVWPEQLKRWLEVPKTQRKRTKAEADPNDTVAPLAAAPAPPPHWPRIFPGL